MAIYHNCFDINRFSLMLSTITTVLFVEIYLPIDRIDLLIAEFRKEIYLISKPTKTLIKVLYIHLCT